MGFKTRRSKALQGNDRAKKSKHEHGEPSSASSSEVAPAPDRVPVGAPDHVRFRRAQTPRARAARSLTRSTLRRFPPILCPSGRPFSDGRR